MAESESLTLLFYRNGKVYRMTIEPTGRKYRRQYLRKRGPMGPRPKVNLKTGDCPECNGTRIAGICTNKNCPTNIKSET